MPKIEESHVVYLTPRPWARPRPAGRRSRSWHPQVATKQRYYNPHQEALDALRDELMVWWSPRPLIEGPVELELVFGLPIPKRTSKKKTLAMVRNTLKHTKKPDLDNLLKLAKDAMSGTVFVDDRQVWKQTCCKVRAERPFYQIIVRA
jgi:Holliday junction resolvase RusA-like endonuclease